MKKTIKQLVKDIKGHSDATKEKMIREYCLEVVDDIQDNLDEYISLDYGMGYGDCSCSWQRTDKWNKKKEEL